MNREEYIIRGGTPCLGWDISFLQRAQYGHVYEMAERNSLSRVFLSANAVLFTSYICSNPQPVGQLHS